MRYDPEMEKWWLPGADVEPYSHPDDSAAKVMQDFPGLTVENCRFSHLESFRGRRGWHLVFSLRRASRRRPPRHPRGGLVHGGSAAPNGARRLGEGRYRRRSGPIIVSRRAARV